MRQRLRDYVDRHPRAVTSAVIGGAALLLVVAVGMAFAVFTGAQPIGEASPVPSASPAASASASPSAASFEPSPSSAPSANQWSDDALLQVSVDGLRVRATASTSADILRTLNRGEVVRIQSGPIEADSFSWYEVIDLDSRSGWVAMGDGNTPWLADVPTEPSSSALLLRFQRDCAVSPRGNSSYPIFPSDLTLTADGRVVLGTQVRQLGPSGLAVMQREVLDLPVLQASADYPFEHRPGAPELPGRDACRNSFWLGEGTERVEVTAMHWLGDEEEATYMVESPERRILDELAFHLADIEAWLGVGAWADPAASPFVSGSYLLWFEPWSSVSPSVTGAAWPFEGPIDQFGNAVGSARCGHLRLGQAFEVLRLLRGFGVTAMTFGSPSRELALDEIGSGTFSTDAASFSFLLTPRTPDGYPRCPDG
jgi:hypothetical protein